MVDVDQAVIARLKKEGQVFEILVDCDKALEFKEGKPVSIGDVVATNEIFKDVKKGDKAPGHELKKLFSTDDPWKISEIIVKQGEIQLTAKHRDKIREEKTRRIINIIHVNAVDSKTGLPHPPQRIENAMREAKVHIDEHKTAEEQVEEILAKLRPIIPIKFETREVAVKIPAQFTGTAFSILKRFKLMKDEWQNDGSLIAIVEMPAGVYEEFESAVNKATHGDAEIKIVRAK